MVSKQAAQRTDGERFNVKELNELTLSKLYQLEFANRFAAF